MGRKSRVVACFLVCLLVASNFFVVKTNAEEEKKPEIRGYWKYTGSVVTGPNSLFDDGVMSGGNGSYFCKAEQKDEAHRGYHDSRDTTSSCLGEYVDITITYTEPPMTEIHVGDEIAIQVNASFSASEYHDSLLFYCCTVSGNMGVGQYHNPETRLVTSDGNRNVGIDRTWEETDYYVYSGKMIITPGDNVLRGIVEPEKQGWDFWIDINFDHGRGEDSIRTSYYYKWIDKPEDEDDEVLIDPWIDQDDEIKASDDKGETSIGIKDGIVDGKDYTDNGNFVVRAIAFGVLVGTGATVIIVTRKKRKGKDPDEQEKKKAKNSQYRMVFYKDFGNKLPQGGISRKVYARIEETRFDLKGGSSVVRRDDLTALIRVREKENLVVQSTVMAGQYMSADICVPKKLPNPTYHNASVNFSFVGEGGKISTDIVFDLMGDCHLVWIDPKTFSIINESGKFTTEMLLNEQFTETAYVGVRNFYNRPDRVEISGPDLTISYEPVDIPSLPEIFAYKVSVSNSIPATSRFGHWPLVKQIAVKMYNEEQTAEGTIDVNLWPEGIFYDTLQVKDEWIENNEIIVDTSLDNVRTIGTEYLFNGIYMDLGVAFRNAEGVLWVDCPNKPDYKQYFRLSPADSASEIALHPTESRIWYELLFDAQRNYHQDTRLGRVVFNPLMPLVVQQVNPYYRGNFTIVYDKYGKYYEDTLCFRFTGTDLNQYDGDKDVEIKRIMTWLDIMSEDNMEKVIKVLQKYGASSEFDLKRFGTGQEKIEFGATRNEIKSFLGRIESVNRIRYIRKMLYEATWCTLKWENIQEHSYVTFIDSCYYGVASVRWLNNVAFSVWWYLLLKDNAGYVEPLASAIKDLVLGYFEEYGKYYAGEKCELDVAEYFTPNRFLVATLDGVQNTLFGMIVTYYIDHGSFAGVTKKQACGLVASLSALVFAKNCRDCAEYDPQTDRIQLDLYAALCGTMKDISINLLKGIVAVLISKAMKGVTDLLEMDSLAKAGEGVISRIKYAVQDVIKNKMAPKIHDYFLTQNTKLELNKDLQSSVMKYLFDDCSDNAVSKIIEYMFGAMTGNFIDSKVKTQGELHDSFYNQSMKPAMDKWVEETGSVAISVTDNTGAEVEVRIPVFAAICVMINDAFKFMGLNDMNLDFSNILPKDCPYMSRDELIEKLNGIPGCQSEVRFITSPKANVKVDSSAFVTGAVEPTMDIGTDWHKYAK